MNTEKAKQLIKNLKHTFNRLDAEKEDQNLETSYERIKIIYKRVCEACDNNEELAIKIIDYALKSHLADKYGMDHPIWEEVKKIDNLFDNLYSKYN